MKYLQIHLYNIEKLKINSILKGVIQIMFISKVKIKNFRNFKDVEVDLGEHMVIVGENKIGKSNFLHALRLVLDPSLPESSRMLQTSDFWDELPRPIKSEEIRIDIELKDFEDDTKLKIILSDFLIDKNPLIAGLSYIFSPEDNADGDEENYIFKVVGTANENTFNYEQRRWLPFEVLSALRDSESDLASWRRSPLRPLIEVAIGAT